MHYEVIFFMMIMSNMVSLLAILSILWRTEKFMSKSLVYMKSKDVNDVLTASHLLDKSSQKDILATIESEVVDDELSEEEKEDIVLRNIQKKHRQHLQPK